MKRSTARWTTAFAAAALIGVPAAGWSQTPPAATSQPPAAQQPADAPAQHGAAAEHIQKAEAALNDIPSSTLPARAKPRVAELKRHLNALEKSAAASHASSTSATKPSSKPKDTWANEVAAIDKVLTELLGPSTAGAPSATGTTGQSKSDTLTLDDTTKAKLMEVRQNVTAFAAAMSGSGSASPSAPSSEPSPEPAAAAAAQAPTASPTPTAESTPPASTSAPSAQSAAAAQPAAASSAAPAEQTQAQAPTAAASSQMDEEGAKRQLTAARDSLAQLTQLPAAAQLTGDARTQVSQLISNFNELITAKSDWRASYDKVAANVTALIGAESAPAEAAAPAPTGTPGAVGTSGSTATALDPAIKGKLVEFRTHLMAFEKAAGAAPSGPSDSAPSAPSDSSSSSSSPAMTPSSSAPSSSAPPASSAAPSASPSSPSPEPAASSSAAEQGAAAAQSSGKMSQDNPISHIDAIEAIIGSGSKLTLEQAQVEQIRTHLAQLRKAVEKK